MIEVKSKLRKWGNSFGIIIPQKVINSQKVREGEEVSVFFKSEKKDMKSVFGSLSSWKIDSQKFKDEIREQEK